MTRYMGTIEEEATGLVVDQTGIVRIDSNRAYDDAYELLPVDGNHFAVTEPRIVVGVKQVHWPHSRLEAFENAIDEAMESLPGQIFLAVYIVAVTAIAFYMWGTP